MKKAIISLLAVLALVAIVAPASATLTTLTNVSQLDYSGITLNERGNPVGGYCLNLGSAFATSVRGMSFRNLAPESNCTVEGASVTGTKGNPSYYGSVYSVGPDATTVWSEGWKMNVIVGNEYFGGTYTFDVTAGQQYRLQMMGVPVAGPATFDVNVAGAVENISLAGGSDVYLYTKTFTATGPTAAINVGDTGMVGSIILTPIPEPATMSLLALGGVSALIRRRK